LLKELTPTPKLYPLQEKVLLDIISPPSLMKTLKNYFKPQALQLIPVAFGEVPQQKSPFAVYVFFDVQKDQFQYEVTDSAAAVKEMGAIKSGVLDEDEFNTLKAQFNPDIKLSDSLNIKVLNHFNEQLQQTIDPIQKRFLLRMISRLLGNQKSIDGLKELLLSLQKNSSLLKLLQEVLDKPPYPDIVTINQWIKDGKFVEHYEAYSMKPYGERELKYAFQESYFHIQKTKYEGVAAGLFSDELARSLSQRLRKNREKTIATLRMELSRLRSISSQPFSLQDKEELLCLCIEMLARTTGQKHPENRKRIISQELNTTQVMTLYAMLATDNNKLISQIDTGEGKSRIAMVLSACEAIRGKTVDVLTSDLDLAERDYLAYTPFFNGLGIPTSLVTINTPPHLYEKRGVNFSDDRQLLLLRNQSDVQGKPFDFLQEEKQKRCLILDEEDVFRHDKSRDLYNYAKVSTRLKGFTWIYPRLVQFMQEQLDKAEEDGVKELSLNELSAQFIKYVPRWENEEHIKELFVLNTERPIQIATWLNSAYQAIRMKEKQHYAASEDMFTVVDAQNKARSTRKIIVLDHGRTIDDSTFAEGLHQCLCALENQKAKDAGFVITPENSTLRSSLTTNFIKMYDEGQLYGISGSTRSDAPRSNESINHENYHYLIAPRHQPLRREEKPIWLAKDEHQQIQFLKRAIIAELKANNPILLICKDDNQSQALYTALIADPAVSKLLKMHQRIHALSSTEEKKKAIEAAGGEGVLTVSTVGNYGRGVDISAENSHPLTVLAAYVPTFEDEIQIKGRTARNGQLGKYRMIPHLKDPDYPIKIKGNTRNVAHEVRKLQGYMATQAAYQEEASKLYADFLEDVTQDFLERYSALKNSGKDAKALLILLENWSSYLGSMQKDWQQCRESLVLALRAKEQVNFINTFKQFTEKWSKGIPSFGPDRSWSYDEKLNRIYTSALLQGSFFNPKHKEPLKLQHGYDPADDGQTRIYDEPFAQLRAVIRGERHFLADYYAWKEGRGELFPDFVATLRGERPLFANLRAIIDKWYQELKAWIYTVEQKEIIKDANLETPYMMPEFVL
jgi:hypothetical protein